ncbi:MAG: hypothetical protein P8130_13070, partial [Deltaproteobacteria bacterium]
RWQAGSSIRGDAKVADMKAEIFRKGREEVERIIGSVEKEIKTCFVLEPEKKIERAQQIADGLAEEASGEIQHRSVNNMNLKIRVVKGKLEKMPAKKKRVKRIAKKK